MSRTQGAFIAIASVVLAASVVVAQQNAPAPAAPVPAGLPDWAYTPPPPAGTPPAPSALPTDDTAIVRIPGTDRTMTRVALRGQKEIVVWYPEERRGQPPAIVKNGRDGFAPAASVTSPMERAGRRMRRSTDCTRRTSSSRWRT